MFSSIASMGVVRLVCERDAAAINFTPDLLFRYDSVCIIVLLLMVGV